MNKKKIIALAMSIIMVLSMATIASAAESKPGKPQKPTLTITKNATNYVKVKSKWSKVSGSNIYYIVQFKSENDISDPLMIGPNTYTVEGTSKTIKCTRDTIKYKVKTRVRAVKRTSKGKTLKGSWSDWSSWIVVKPSK